ncbi:N-acetylglucosamine kinase [Terrimonas pollutisoli]|uniref:N-acetylglucosamine kinase n=1 Tax=Terrimonas pollutisoli TaxID=3034147 RepID=UPI0023EAD30B|nr:N-acetylglucosamine kinase [Terrimonas sp. H1YJ31]
MDSVKLIADSGATKAEWSLITNGKRKTFLTQGISPYFLNQAEISALLLKELKPKLKNIQVDEIYYYGTGCANPDNAKLMKKAIKAVFPEAAIDVNHDLLAAARALCGDQKGIACILGTGSNSCYYSGKKIVTNSPGLGYVLGDEGSGAYLGKRVLQYYLYNTFDDELRGRFDVTYLTNSTEILENVYKNPLPNRYLASFVMFLAENRGHYMIENIIEDCLNDFFFTHLCKYKEVWSHPVNFVGSVAFGFKDVLEQLCHSYEFELGKVLKKPMSGLIEYHS